MHNLWKEGPWNSPTVLDTAQNKSEETFMENSSDAAHQLYSGGVNNCEAMKEEYYNLYKRHADLVDSNRANVSKLEEMSFWQKCYENLTNEWNVSLQEKSELQHQCTAVTSLCHNVVRQRDIARGQVAKACEYIAMLAEERNTVLREKSLLMSERDTMLEEMKRMQKELNKAQKLIQSSKTYAEELKEPTYSESSDSNSESEDPTSEEFSDSDSESEDPTSEEFSDSDSDSEDPTSGESSGTELEDPTSGESSSSDSESDPTSEESSCSHSKSGCLEQFKFDPMLLAIALGKIDSRPGETETDDSARESGEFADSESSESFRNSELDSTYTAGAFSEKYTHLKLLCKGTFGCVSKGHRNSDGLLVITKFIIKLEVFNEDLIYNHKMQKNMPMEVTLLQHIDHPNIIKVFDVFENDLYYQLVMEKHGCGMDLDTFVRRNKCRDEPLISYIFRQIVKAISFLHMNDIVHRDVKVENCVIDENFHVKLIDFGSAAFISQGPFSEFYGTEQYGGPEIVRKEKYGGEEVEMFALGVTLYVLAFRSFPFQNEEDILKGEYEIPECASEGLSSLISNLLEPVPTRLHLEKVYVNRWVNQPVQIERYSFASVINATEEELHPKKYHSIFDEICSTIMTGINNFNPCCSTEEVPFYSSNFFFP